MKALRLGVGGFFVYVLLGALCLEVTFLRELLLGILSLLI
jgi:hypothetical protein